MPEISDTTNVSLIWVNPVNQAPEGTTLRETLKLTENSVLLSDVYVTCILDATGVVFENTKTNTWTGSTNLLGRLSLGVISLTGDDTPFNINACLTHDPVVQAPPLSVSFISEVGSVSLLPKDVTSSPYKLVTLTATVTNKNGRALPGTTVTFSEYAGATLTPATAITDENGQASTQVSTDNLSLVIVTATAHGQSDSTRVLFYYNIVEFYLTPKDIHASSDEVLLTATVTGMHGEPLQGVVVTFSSKEWVNMTRFSDTTDKNGQASTVVSQTYSGQVTVTATAHGQYSDGTLYKPQDSTTIYFQLPDDNINLILKEFYAAVDESVTLTDIVTDKNGGAR